MKATAIIASAITAFIVTSTQAATIYRQDFDQDPTQVVPASTNSEIALGTGWHIQAPTVLTAGVFSNVLDLHPAGSAESAGISSDAAAPSNGHNTLASSSTIEALSQGATPARIFFNGANTFNAILYTETTVDRSIFDLTSVSWWTRNNTGAGSRLAVQVGGQWYASSLVFTDTADAGATWTQHTDTLAGETFRPFNFTPLTTLDQALTNAPQALPDGNITAFGLFLAHSTSNGNNRVDGFTLTGNASVPEPSAILGLAGPAALLLRRRR